MTIKMQSLAPRLGSRLIQRWAFLLKSDVSVTSFWDMVRDVTGDELTEADRKVITKWAEECAARSYRLLNP